MKRERPGHSFLAFSHTIIMAIQSVPLPLPPSADPSKFTRFGREVIGLDPGNLSPSDFAEIQRLLYEVHDPPFEYSLSLSPSSMTPSSSETQTFLPSSNML